MATDNLKEFATQWVLFGLLFTCLTSFSIVFMDNNNPTALGKSGELFNNYTSETQSKLFSVEGDSNVLLNISAQNNPEVSDQGSRDSVATSYKLVGSSRGFFNSIIPFIGWIFSGPIGKLLISVFVGLFGFGSIYFITKWIRQGG